MTELDLATLKARAEAHRDAYEAMCEIGFGIGALHVQHPDKAEHMKAWDDSTENDHADTVLELIGEIERVRAEISNLIDELDYARSSGHIYTYGAVQEKLRSV